MLNDGDYACLVQVVFIKFEEYLQGYSQKHSHYFIAADLQHWLYHMTPPLAAGPGQSPGKPRMPRALRQMSQASLNSQAQSQPSGSKPSGGSKLTSQSPKPAKAQINYSRFYSSSTSSANGPGANGPAQWPQSHGSPRATARAKASQQGERAQERAQSPGPRAITTTASPRALIAKAPLETSTRTPALGSKSPPHHPLIPLHSRLRSIQSQLHQLDKQQDEYADTTNERRDAQFATLMAMGDQFEADIRIASAILSRLSSL